MTDIELFQIDAEYWDGQLTPLEWSQLLEPSIPRMAYIETLYGINHGADGRWIDYVAFSADKHSTRCFFSLMIACELRWQHDEANGFHKSYVDSDKQVRTSIR